MTLLERARHMKDGVSILLDWLGSDWMPVDKELAQSRADVCLQCPLNKLQFSLTGEIAMAIKRQMELKKHLSMRVKGEKSLGQCEGCGCYLRLKVWERLERILPTPEERGNYWDQCWLLKESNP